VKTRKSCKVRLYIRIRRADRQYAYTEPAWNGNRTLREGYALVGGRVEAHPEGIYYLRYLRGKKRIWESVGSAADVALTALSNKEHDLQAAALGRIAPEPVTKETDATTVGQAIEAYLVNIRRFRSKKTLVACTKMLGLCAATFGTRPLVSLRREDLLDHTADLTAKGLAPRTVFNHITRVKSFLRSQGITDLLRPEDVPVYDEREVEAYSTDELNNLFQAANDEERLLFRFFLLTGFRDQEVQFCTWRNVAFQGKVISVRSKPELGFRPKDKEERSVPVPDALIEALAKRKRTSKSHFVFCTQTGQPDGHCLRRLQQLALRAGLNCGECVKKGGKSCRTHPVCRRWGLHKFRKTFGTLHSEAGVPVTTIQRWLGHSDLATTLRYLAVADLRSDRTRQQVNTTFAALASNRIPALEQATNLSDGPRTPTDGAQNAAMQIPGPTQQSGINP
jgi:integrase/recombinase XerD